MKLAHAKNAVVAAVAVADADRAAVVVAAVTVVAAAETVAGNRPSRADQEND